jgi:predicted nucleic acid-binding protein
VTTVFLDTVGLIALWDDADQWHQDASRAYSELRQSRFIGVTTDAVILECGNAAARRPYRRDVNLLRQRLARKGRLVVVTDAEWESSWEAYDRGDAGNASIVDQASFVVMRRLGISRAFTNDEHFRAAGFETMF